MIYYSILFLPSIGYIAKKAGFLQRRRSDEGGQLHGTCSGCCPASEPLLARLGCQVILASTVLHAIVCH